MIPAAPSEVIRIYGGISQNCWTRTHHEPTNWAEGQDTARLLADGGEFKIAALYPAGVSLRQETVPQLSRDLPKVSREETFPCTRMTVEPIAEKPAPSVKAPSVEPAREPTVASAGRNQAIEGGLFGGSDW